MLNVTKIVVKTIAPIIEKGRSKSTKTPPDTQNPINKQLYAHVANLVVSSILPDAIGMIHMLATINKILDAANPAITSSE